MKDANDNEVVKTEFPERSQAFDLTSFACPRCQSVTGADWYGPCQSCVDELQLAQRTEAALSEAAAYEPKMNVTPNAVALKDD